MRGHFWLRRKSMWRSRTDGLAMKGLTEEERNQQMKRGWCKRLQPERPDRCHLIVAVNPLVS